jgi:YYY domain-containing protein
MSSSSHAPSSPSPRLRRTQAGRRESIILTTSFVLALAAAAYFRFIGLNWDDNQHLHPDERFLTMVETTIVPVKNLGQFFDSVHSTLNPVNYQGYGFFVYGTLPLFLVRYVGQALHQTGYNQITLVGRQLSALADLGAILFLFVLARRLYGNRVAVLATILSALAVLPIQQSHFFTVDTFANFFVVAAFDFILRASQNGRWRDFAISGLAVGMAFACKLDIWPLAGFVAMAAVLYWLRDPQGAVPDSTRTKLKSTSLKLVLAGILCVLAFRVFQPYAFTGPHIWNISLEPRWRANMLEVYNLVSGNIDYPPGDQWTNRAPILFPWTNMVVWGLGLPLGLAVWAGWAWVGWKIVRARQWRDHLLPWLWATLFFIYQGTQWVKSMRYILPVYPFFILFAAYLLVNFKFQISNFKFQRKTSFALASIVVVGTFAWAWGFTRIYTRPVTRITASSWIYANAPTAITLHYAPGSSETGDPSNVQLPLPPQVTFSASQPLITPFRAPQAATLDSITINHLTNQGSVPGPETIHVIMAEDPAGQQVVAQASLTAQLEADGSSGSNYTFSFSPVSLEAGREYYLTSSVAAGGPVTARTSTIATEQWDDALPLPVDGQTAGVYNNIQMQPYAEDTPTKLTQMLSWLSQADYIVLSSNRLYASIPRLPMRYPMTTEYYRALFQGQLGFTKVAEFDSYPNIGPFWSPDQESTQALGIPNPFDRVARRTNVPLPPAEEAFSVYDHPRVVIYRKTADFSPEKVAQILGQIDLSQTVQLLPKQATAAPTTLMLNQQDWSQQQQSGTWSQLYDRASPLNRFPVLGILATWVLLAVLGALAWPVTAFAFPTLPDRGWGLARTLGLLTVAYLAWLAASVRVLTFGRGTLIAAIGVLALAGLGLAWARRAALINFLRRSWRLVLVEEAAFALVFVIFLLIRYGNGDLWNFYYGGERPMDFAYLNAVLKSVYFPPYDPWFAGGEMNYYYFGYVLVAVPIKLWGLVPAIAYNIVLPMLAALTGLGAFSVAFNLLQVSHLLSPISNNQSSNWRLRSEIGDWRFALLAVLFVVFIGNLGEIRLILDALSQLGGSTFHSAIPILPGFVSVVRGLGKAILGQPLPVPLADWYWNASRIMTNGEITEFPFFTFLYSDLHAHMMAYPLTVLMLGVGVGWALRREWRSLDAAVSVVIGALVVGVARANNTWDYPTYLVLAFLALFASGLQARGNWLGIVVSGTLGVGLFGAAWALGGINDLLTFLAIAVALIVVGQLVHRLIEAQPGSAHTMWGAIDLAYIALMGLSILYLMPYIEHYATAYSSVTLWNGPRTPIKDYVLIHGIFLFPIATFLIVQARRMGSRWFAAALHVSGVRWEWVLATIVAAIAVWSALILIGYTVILIAGPLIALTTLALFRRTGPAVRFLLLGVLLALGLTIAVEVVVLKGDIGRMNTVFKFYLQVWIILAIAAAVMIGWLVRWFNRNSHRLGRWWGAAMVALIAAGLLYPIFATPAKINDRFSVRVGPTLDAMKYMTLAQATERGQTYSFRDEYEMLIWMQDHIQGTPIVAGSAASPIYRSLRARVSTYTGLPTLIGYDWHERQQRSILPTSVVDQRLADANKLFATTDTNVAWQLIQKYDISYIIVGYPERLYYPAAGLAKFDQMVKQGRLIVAHKNANVTLYQVVK